VKVIRDELVRIGAPHHQPQARSVTARPNLSMPHTFAIHHWLTNPPCINVSSTTRVNDLVRAGFTASLSSPCVRIFLEEEIRRILRVTSHACALCWIRGLFMTCLTGVQIVRQWHPCVDA